MNTPLNFEDLFRTDVPEEWAGHVAYTVSSILRASRLALENENGGLCSDGEKIHAVADVLEIAEALNSIVIDGVERLQRDCGHSIAGKEAAA